MDIQISHSAPAATAGAVPEFPLVRFDTGRVVYQEALIHGQYLAVHNSAMGRPQPREWVWSQYRDAPAAWYNHEGLSPRHHAFQLEVDGQLLNDGWVWQDAAEVDAGRPGCRESVIRLRHARRPVTVEVHTRLDDTPFLARWLVITPTGERPAAVSHVMPWSGRVWRVTPWDSTAMPSHADALFTLGRFTDSTAGAEGAFDWLTLPDGQYGFESRHGRSGWGSPFAILRNEATGEALVCQFAWSGNWQMVFFNDHEPARRPLRPVCLYAAVGLAGPAPLRVLEPGESARTPEVHFGFLFGDLDACVQALHDHQRRSVLLPPPEGRAHLVDVNHIGYTRNAQLTGVGLQQQIEVAAAVGAELFMLDAGWFGEPSHLWFESVGDWQHENPLLVGGVNAAFDLARAHGMHVGLWVEAERMGAASQLLRDHPDWQMVRRGQPLPNLDLSRPDVARHVEDTLVGLVERYRLDCLRLDYNISIGDGGEAERGGYRENTLWRYYDALYALFERLHARFPQLLLENCAGGGGRADLGMLARFHWTQVSDRWSPDPTLKIVNGMTLALAPETCATLLGAISDGAADLDFLLRIGLFGHFCASGIFPDMTQQQAAARARWQHTIALYKTFVRPLLPTCRMYHHTPVQRLTEAGDWVVLECAGAGGAYAGIFRLAGAQDEAYRFVPRGLDPARRYRVTFDSAGLTRVVDGAQLAEQGVRVPVRGAYTSELLLFEASADGGRTHR